MRKFEELTSCLPEGRGLVSKEDDGGGFGQPSTRREIDAIDEKVRALEILFSQRISVLTGGAGTGTTSVLKVFLRHLREVEGPSATLLAAPTGKARVRLQAASGICSK